MTDAPALFDAAAIAHAKARARRLSGDRFLEQAAAQGLADRLGTITRRFTRGLWIGEAVHPELTGFAATWECASIGENEALLRPDGVYGLAVSLFSLQTVNDLPGVLIQIAHALKPDGLFIAALLGGSTLSELRDSFAQGEIATRGGISPRVAPLVDVRDGGALLQRAGFALPVTDVEKLMVRYGDVFALVRDLRAHGLTNVLTQRSRAILRRDTLAAMLAHYSAHHSDPDGRIRARFDTLYLTGWTPHESQQKPLRPGSARSRLADALGTVEKPIGSRSKR
jgi:SAM-dependent methyltransferase